MDDVEVIFVNHKEIPLILKAAHAVVEGDHRFAAIALITGYRLVHVCHRVIFGTLIVPSGPLGLIIRVVVSRGEDETVVADNPSGFRFFLICDGIRPEILHPVAFFGGFGDFLAQLVAVGADHVFDVRAFEVGKNWMCDVEVVFVNQEEVELLVNAWQ